MILVTGSTGMVGSHLLYFLLKENQRVRAIHRKGSDLQSVRKIFSLYTSQADSLFEKIEWMKADITDIPALTEAFEGITKVYHCAAYINFNPSKYKILKKINAEGTANMVNLCLAKKVEKLCYVSSVGTLGRAPNSQLTTEEAAWNADDKNSVYTISKYSAEMEVWRGTQEGLDAVIVNPGIILGSSPDGGGSGIIPNLGARGISFYPSGGMGVVDVQDVVKAMLFLMTSSIKNERYILIGENISYKELLSKLAVLNGKKPPRKKLSKKIMLLLSGIDWFVSKVFRSKRRLVKATVRSMFKTSYYDNSKIKNMGFHFTPLDETLERLLVEATKEA